MTPILVHLQPFDKAAAARIDVRLADAGSADAYGLSGVSWSPYITERPMMSLETMAPDLDGKVQAGRARMAFNPLSMPAIAGRDIKWRGGTAKIYSAAALAWPAVTEFDGEVVDEAIDPDGIVSITMEVKTDFLEGPFLVAEYTGGGGALGEAGLRGTLKPAGFGTVENIEPVWFDTTRWIGCIDGYSNTVSITKLMEGLDDRGAAVANYANYAALAAAIDGGSVPPGRWATCLAEGLVGLGAPPVHPIGVNATFGTNRIGAMMRRVLEIHRGVAIGNIDTAAFSAMDTACPYDTTFWTKDQRDCKDLLEAMAGSINATPLVTFQNKVTITRGVTTGAIAELVRSGRTTPRVIDVRRATPVRPVYRLKARTARPANVLTYDQVLYEDTIEDKGAYSGSEVYRKGHIVWSADKSSWLYINATPAAGNAPPTWPTTSNAYWQNMTPPVTSASLTYADGTPLEARKPAALGADVTAANTAAGIVGQGALATLNAANWATQVIGTGKPANNAGTTLNLYDFTAGRHLIYGNEVEKIGASGWTSNVYSRESYTGSFTISGRMDPAQGAMMFGVTDSPGASNFEELDYAFYGSGGPSQIYESGNGGSTFGGYNADTLFTIDYDGVWLRYLIDGNEVARRAVGPNRKFWAGISIFNTGAKMPGITFGPYNDAAASPVIVNPLKLIGNYSQIVGNSVRKIGGTHGAYEGGVVGAPQKGSMFVSARPIQGNTWTTLIGLDYGSEGNTNPNAAGVWAAQITASSSGGGGLYIIKDGTVIASWGIANFQPIDRFALVCNNRRIFAMLNGAVYGGNSSAYDITPDTVSWPKVFDFYLSGLSGDPINEGIIDIRYGAWNDVRSFRDDGLTPMNQAEIRTIEGVSSAITGQGPGATAPGNDVLNYRNVGGEGYVAYPEGGMFSSNSPSQVGALHISMPLGSVYSMVSFELDIFDYNAGHSVKYRVAGYIYNGAGELGWINCSAQFVGPEDRSLPITFGFKAGKACVRVGYIDTAWQYPKMIVSNFIVGYSNSDPANWRAGWVLGLFASYLDHEAVQILKPRPGDAVFGEGIKEGPGGATATNSNYKTGLGTAAGIVGQGTGATSNNLNDLDPTAAGTLAGLVANGAITVGEFQTIKKNLAPGAAVVLNGRYGVAAGGGTGDLSAQIQSTPAGAGSWSAVATSSTTPVGPSEPGSRQVSGTFTNTTGQQQVFEFRIAGIRSPGGSGGATLEHQTFLTG